MRPSRLFVYGTLAPGRRNQHQLTALGGDWQPAEVRGTLHAAGWGATYGYPALILDPAGDPVSGFVLTSDKLADHWERLDAFEGEAYERVATRVRLDDGQTVEAFVYVLRPS
ncbi:MAG: gamma-glutamylcyclotransferase family protein [Acidobacteriota bacterium]